MDSRISYDPERKLQKIEVIRVANPNCKECYGRGYIKVYHPSDKTSTERTCHCIKKQMTKTERINTTYKEK